MRRLTSTLALALSVALVAGCGAAATGGGTAGEAAPGVTADTITFGMVAPLTGPTAALGIDARAGAEALIATVNADGGINGRMLALEVQDDQYDPQQAVAGARYFTSPESVLGIWGNTGTATTLAALPTLESVQMPLLFPMAMTSKLADYDRAYRSILPLGDQFELFSTWVAGQPQLSAARFGALYQNDGTSAEVIEGFGRGPVPLVSEVPFERTSTSYAAQLQRLAQDQVTDVVFIGNPNQAAVALREADQAGMDVRWWSSLGNTSPDLVRLAGPLAEGVSTVNPFATPDSDVPGVAAFRDAMTQYQPDATKSLFALNSWVGGLLIVDALRRAGPDLTRGSFLAALDSTSNVDVGGIMPPVTLTAGDHLASKCIQIARIDGGAFVLDGEPTCLS